MRMLNIIRAEQVAPGSMIWQMGRFLERGLFFEPKTMPFIHQNGFRLAATVSFDLGSAVGTAAPTG